MMRLSSFFILAEAVCLRRADILLALLFSWWINSSIGTYVRKLKLTSMFWPIEEGEFCPDSDRKAS